MLKNVLGFVVILSLVLLTGSLSSDNTAYAYSDLWSGISSGDTCPAMWDPSGTDQPFNGTMKGSGKQIYVSGPRKAYSSSTWYSHKFWESWMNYMWMNYMLYY